MIIPAEDSEFIESQSSAVVKFWLQCWRCDPYGNRWEILEHNLKPTSFKKAKKVLEKAGLFAFKPDKSSSDKRKTERWYVMNFHGARSNSYWLSSKTEGKTPTDSVANLSDSVANLPDSVANPTSIVSQSQSQHTFQNLSGEPQENLSNSSKELLKVLPVEKGVSDRDRDLALKGQVTSASLQDENSSDNDFSLPTKLKADSEPNTKETCSDQSVLNKKSTKDYSCMSIQDLINLDIENMSLNELQKLPDHQTRGVETSGKMSKAVREKKIADHKLRSDYTSRVQIAITKRLDEDKRNAATKTSISPLTRFKERLNAKCKNDKIADRNLRLDGDNSATSAGFMTFNEFTQLKNRPSPEEYDDVW